MGDKFLPKNTGSRIDHVSMPKALTATGCPALCLPPTGFQLGKNSAIPDPIPRAASESDFARRRAKGADSSCYASASPRAPREIKGCVRALTQTLFETAQLSACESILEGIHTQPTALDSLHRIVEPDNRRQGWN